MRIALADGLLETHERTTFARASVCVNDTHQKNHAAQAAQTTPARSRPAGLRGCSSSCALGPLLVGSLGLAMR